MKKFCFFLIVVINFFLSQTVWAQGPYSSASVNVFNTGLTLHKQGKYELAQQKYLEALSIQPNFVEAKNNLLIAYQNSGYENYNKKNYQNAIYYYKKAYEMAPQDVGICNNLALSYNSIQDFENAAIMYKKVITLDNKNTKAMHSLAQVYLNTNQFDKAQNLYRNILFLSPADETAKTNLKFAAYNHDEKITSENLNNISTQSKAPIALYRLIKASNGITPATIEKTQRVLDLIWSEPSGKMMLEGILIKKVPINITQGTQNAYASKSSQTRTFMIYGFIPVASFTSSHLEINIPFSYVKDFYDPNQTAHHRIYCLQVFIHELAHAYMNVKNPHNTDSLEEEIGVSMIGYNIANKLITGQYLSPDKTEQYGLNCLESALQDDHRNLPIYSGFNSTAKFYGLNLPYPETYSNLIMMYKKLLAEGKVKPVPNFYKYAK